MQVGFTMMAQPCVKDERTPAENIGCTKLQVPERSDQQAILILFVVRYQPPLY